MVLGILGTLAGGVLNGAVAVVKTVADVVKDRPDEFTNSFEDAYKNGFFGSTEEVKPTETSGEQPTHVEQPFVQDPIKK